MSFELPELPYNKTDLAPNMSEKTLIYHHDKHHKNYVEKINSLIKDTKFETMKLEEIILSAKKGAIFNNAAQHWNHSFFWNCLTPKSSLQPSGKLLKSIKQEWGSFDKFKEAFTKSAIDNFGSGWTWFVKNDEGKLEIINTSNAETPMTKNLIALLVVDIWEHAYYIDYSNDRPKFIEAFWCLVNWEFVSKNLDRQINS